MIYDRINNLSLKYLRFTPSSHAIKYELIRCWNLWPLKGVFAKNERGHKTYGEK